MSGTLLAWLAYVAAWFVFAVLFVATERTDRAPTDPDPLPTAVVLGFAWPLVLAVVAVAYAVDRSAEALRGALDRRA